MDEIQPTNRRTVLQRGLGFIAAAVGLELIDPGARAHAEIVKSGEQTGLTGGKVLRFHVTRWHTHAHAHRPGQLPGHNERMNRQGELLDPVTRQMSGEFFATCFCPTTSFGGPSGSGAGIEFHTFRLGTDTLFGMGAPGTLPGGAQMHAIVGGTGRFAGARGSYVVNPSSTKGKGEEVEIVITIN
jgi:hypothetical protein